MGFPGGLVVKNLPANAGDTGLIPGSGRSPGGRNGNPLQYYCLGNPMDRGTQGTAVHGVAKESNTTERVNNNSSLVSLHSYRGVYNILIYNIYCPIEGEAVETVSDFIFLGSKITADGDCSHEIKRHSFKGKL